MKELLNLLAMKSLRKKSNSKAKTKFMANDKKDTEALIAKLALEASKDHIHKKRDPSVGANENENVTFEKDIANFTSAEEMENILQKLKFMGPKGKRVLELLKKQVTLDEGVDELQTTTPLPRTLSTLNATTEKTETTEETLLRQKREFVLKTALKHKELNEEEEENANLAIEEVFSTRINLPMRN